jgi:hypothetical protein
MIGMHDSTGITASFRQTNTPLNAFSNSCATPALRVPDRGLVYASDSLNLARMRDFDYRTCMEQELPLMTGEALQKRGEDYSWYVGISSGNQAVTGCAFNGSNLPTRRHYFRFAVIL